MKKLAALLLALWLGMHIGFGYIAAPVLFSNLHDLSNGHLLAGRIAGTLFHTVNLLGLAAWSLVWWSYRCDNRVGFRQSRVTRWALAVLVLTAANEFLVTPVIEALKNGRSNWLQTWLGGGFSTWHGVSSAFYLAAALIGGGLCVLLLHLDRRN